MLRLLYAIVGAVDQLFGLQHVGGQMAGVTAKVAQQVIDRDKGRCVVRVTHQGMPRLGEQIHHRKPRGMGGTSLPWVNRSGNLLYVCADCHTFLESHRYDAIEHGWLIQGRALAAEVPVFYVGRWMLLDDEGAVSLPVGVP